MTYNIMVVKIAARQEMSPKVQQVLAEFGCNIRVRLGLHDLGDDCIDEGLLVLQLTGQPQELQQLAQALHALEGVQAKLISL